MIARVPFHRSRYRGAALLVIVLIIFAVAIFGAIAAGSMSASDVTDSNSQGFAVEALYAAETGVERALKQFSTSAYAPPPAAAATPCISTNFPGAPTINVATNRTFAPTFKGATDFDGASALPFSQCRMEFVGTVSGSNIPVKLQAILDRNLLSGENPGFNDPAGTAAVNGWTGNAGAAPRTGAFDYTGGIDAALAGSGTRCTRAGYAVKARSGGASTVGSASGTIPVVPNFTVTPGQTITIRFDYRVIQVASSGNNNCTSVAAAPAVAPPGGATANHAQIWFSVIDSANTPYTTLPARVFNVAQTNTAPLNTRTIGTGPCVPTTQSATAAADYGGSCATRYQAGSPATKGQTTIDVPAGSTGIIKSLTFYIYLSNAVSNSAREAWIDNIELINSTGKVVANAEWRDCSVMTCL